MVFIFGNTEVKMLVEYCFISILIILHAVFISQIVKISDQNNSSFKISRLEYILLNCIVHVFVLREKI